MLWPGKSLGSISNALWDAIQLLFVLKVFSTTDHDHIYFPLVNEKVSQHKNKNKCKAHCSLSLEESNHQMIKKLDNTCNICSDQKTRKF